MMRATSKVLRRSSCALVVLAALLLTCAVATAAPASHHHHRHRHWHQARSVIVSKHVRSPGMFAITVRVWRPADRRDRVSVRIGRRAFHKVTTHRRSHVRFVVRRVRIAGGTLKVRVTSRRGRPLALRVKLRRVHVKGRHKPAKGRPGRPPKSSPTSSASTTPSAPVSPPPTTPSGQPGVYWGGWVGPQLTGTPAPWDMTALSDFERDAGKNASVVHFSSPFANCSSSPCTPYNFPTPQFTAVRNDGAIPFFSWGTESLPTSGNQSAYNLPSIINGNFDTYIRNWAIAAKSWGHPFFLRFDWEMNGNWFPWNEGQNGNQSGDFVAAWRHVHDIFTSVGATNVTWVWCPNIDPYNHFVPVSHFYPGDQYVDWTCIDAYNFDQPWLTFDQLVGPTYQEITATLAPSKPMIVGETASTESGGSKAGWITAMFSDLQNNYPRIRGVLWMENNVDGDDWPIESSASATAAFAAGISNPRYVGNSYASLDGLTPVSVATTG
jgi:hypothetical protein